MSILITGGTGSFGKAFTERLLNDHIYRRICIYSRGEHTQDAMREKFNNDERLRFFIGDVRDRDRLKRAMEGVDVVVHAAALKRIEVGAYNPTELVKTNVLGTMNVIDAAQDAQVKKVVALSSDKAFQPISPYGQSKALMEGLVLAANNTVSPKGPKFAVTRYGNVMGSQGSIIPKWRSILEKSAIVPVTDPEATRFWMFMSEAVDLVLDTIETMPKMVNIPKLPAFRLRDLAEAMGAKMRITGLPDWEKKHESLDFGMSSENAERMNIDQIKKALQKV